MKKLLLLLLLSGLNFLSASPRINFNDLMLQSEREPLTVFNARNLAVSQNIPVNILTRDRIMIDAKGIEDGKVVYSVFKNLLDVYNGGYTAYYNEVISGVNLSECRIDFGNGVIIDNTNGMYNPVITRSVADMFIMITEATFDRVYLFNANNGDLLDTAFIPHTVPQLSTPKQAILHVNGRQVLIADQITDVVQRFDTNGTYIGVHSPIGGVNNAILDNIRSVTFRAPLNYLVTVGSGASSNTVQQFDSAGNHIGSFISTNLNSPFDVLIRSTDVLVSNSSGTDRISRYNTSGVFQSFFYTGSSFAFPEQLIRLPNSFVVAAAFSTPSGIAVLDSAGTFRNLLTAVTGNRGVYLLGSGRYLTTNGAGVHEVDSASGSLIRTVVTGSGFQYISPYNPGGVVGIINNGNVPASFELYQNYPNPFNPSTKIKYLVSSLSSVRISVYDVTGKEIAVLIDKYQMPGNYEVEFNAAELPSGVYFYKLQAGDFSTQKKMVLLK